MLFLAPIYALYRDDQNKKKAAAKKKEAEDAAK
jgi:hypothetical protein